MGLDLGLDQKGGAKDDGLGVHVDEKDDGLGVHVDDKANSMPGSPLSPTGPPPTPPPKDDEHTAKMVARMTNASSQKRLSSFTSFSRLSGSSDGDVPPGSTLRPIPARPPRPGAATTPTHEDKLPGVTSPMPSFGFSKSAATPEGLTPIRSATSSARASWNVNLGKRPVKYGQGRHRNVELSPQPSDDDEDPLNWPRWKKELHFSSLLLVVVLNGAMKTAFMSVNNMVAGASGTTPTGAAVLTGVPLIISAASGLASLVVSRLYGKRPVYLVAMVFLLVGVAWSTNMRGNYAQHMAARAFQGLGWGAFDSLVLGSIQDTFFEHERGMRLALHAVAVVAGTWGPPLIGGYVSQNIHGYSTQFVILSAFVGFAVLAVVVGAPETAFDRSAALLRTVATTSSGPMRPPLLPVRLPFARHLSTLKPVSFHGGKVDLHKLLQAPRACAAPTTVLIVLVSALPLSALWGLTASLSLLFSRLPFMMLPTSLGLLLAGPLILGTMAAAAYAWFPSWHCTNAPDRPTSFTMRNHLLAIGLGAFLSLVGILAFGIDVANTSLTPDAGDKVVIAANNSSLSMPLLSILLGFVAAGAYTLDGTARPLIHASTLFTSSNPRAEMRATADMNGAVACWRALLSGIFVVLTPAAVDSPSGLRHFAIGMAVSSAVLAGAVGAAWWLWKERLRRIDGRVMAMVELGGARRSGSFFDSH